MSRKVDARWEIFNSIWKQMTEMLINKGFEIDVTPCCIWWNIAEIKRELDSIEVEGAEDEEFEDSELFYKIERRKRISLACWKRPNEFAMEVIELNCDGDIRMVDVFFEIYLDNPETFTRWAFFSSDSYQWLDASNVGYRMRKENSYKVPACFLWWRASKFIKKVVDDTENALIWFDEYNTMEKCEEWLERLKLLNPGRYERLKSILDEIKRR